MIKKTYRIDSEMQQKIDELIKIYDAPSENLLFKALVNDMHDIRLKRKGFLAKLFWLLSQQKQ